MGARNQRLGGDMAKTFKMPHTLVLLVALMGVAMVLTWILPSGAFQMETTETGARVVVPGTFEVVDDVPFITPWDLITAIPRAMGAASDVIFFVFLIGGVLGVLRATGAIDAGIGSMLESYRHRMGLLMFIAMFIFGVCSASFGMSAEYIAFVGILIALCAALRLDTMTAIGILVLGYGVGYGISPMNPFTVLIAQGIAEVPPLSGWWYRLVVAVPFFAIAFHHVYSYARRVQKDPAASYVAGVESAKAPPPEDYPPLTKRRIAVLVALGLTVIGLFLGVRFLGWYLTELAGLFLVLCGVAIVISGMKLNEAAEKFIAGAAALTTTALLVGFARGIALILEDGLVLHTIVNALATPLSQVPAELSAVGMFLIQTLLNLFVPSGSGQAFVTMPLMAPIGDLVGVSRQVAVLAYQFGDGFSNMIVPTNAVLMGILGIAGIPYDRWLRFVVPLMIKLTLAASLALVIAVWIGYT
jgi:uncharacterized ion transporter superfamily protein YfcC